MNTDFWNPDFFNTLQFKLYWTFRLPIYATFLMKPVLYQPIDKLLKFRILAFFCLRNFLGDIFLFEFDSKFLKDKKKNERINE